MIRLFTALLMLSLVAGCGGQRAAPPEGADAPADAGSGSDSGGVSSEPAAESAVTEPTAGIASDQVQAVVPGALTGEDFIAQAESLSGETITLARCSLMTEPSADGDYACRVTDDQDMDLKDPDGLPVDVFFNKAELSPEAAAWLAENCPDMFCIVQLTGDLAVSPETFFLELSNVSFAKAGAIQ